MYFHNYNVEVASEKTNPNLIEINYKKKSEQPPEKVTTRSKVNKKKNTSPEPKKNTSPEPKKNTSPVATD